MTTKENITCISYKQPDYIPILTENNEVKFVKSRLRTKDEFKGIKRGQRSKLNMLVFPMSAEGKSRLNIKKEK